MVHGIDCEPFLAQLNYFLEAYEANAAEQNYFLEAYEANAAEQN